MPRFRKSVSRAALIAATLIPAALVPALARTPRTAPSSASAPDDPTPALLARYRAAAARKGRVSSTGLTRADYLRLMASEVSFWKKHQDGNGAIIDPYRHAEFQYATPAYAHAAAALVAYAGRRDLRESAALAVDWAARRLSERKAASGHEDFYAPMLAHAISLLRTRVDPGRVARWEADIRRFDPAKTYRFKAGKGNWNVVAVSGEAMFQSMKLRQAPHPWVEASLAGQEKQFAYPYGLYLEGAMAYDHFPRLWAADMISHGYGGMYAGSYTDRLRRAAVTSLFMQSPWGELPAGGRSAQHQWNEAAQCVTYEIYAAEERENRNPALAAVYKRAAHLSLGSLRRWVRPSGEMQIVKNWIDPSLQHGYESYSSHSQYNLLAMSMLAIAYEHAGRSEGVGEKATPADTGGFVLDLPQLHKVIANAGGTYIEVETRADKGYDANGLIRVHQRGVPPQLGPSDSVLAHPKYHTNAAPGVPPPARLKAAATGVGIAWREGNSGKWRRIGEVDRAKATVRIVRETPAQVAFDVTYQGRLFGVPRVIEHYVVAPGRVTLTTEIPGYKGPLRYFWPILDNDGKYHSMIRTQPGGKISVSLAGSPGAQTFTAVGATGLSIGADRYPNHNGWARLATAEFPAGKGRATLVIQPQSNR